MNCAEPDAPITVQFGVCYSLATAGYKSSLALT